MARITRMDMWFSPTQRWSISAEVELANKHRLEVFGVGDTEMAAKRDLYDDWATHHTYEFLPLPI